MPYCQQNKIVMWSIDELQQTKQIPAWPNIWWLYFISSSNKADYFIKFFEFLNYILFLQINSFLALHPPPPYKCIFSPNLYFISLWNDQPTSTRFSSEHH